MAKSWMLSPTKLLPAMNQRRPTSSCRRCSRLQPQASILVLMSTKSLVLKAKMKRIQMRLKPAVKRKKLPKLDASKKPSKRRKLPNDRRRKRRIRNAKWKKSKELRRRSKNEKPARPNNRVVTRKNSRNKRLRSKEMKKKLEDNSYFATNKRMTTTIIKSRLLLSRLMDDSTLRVVTTARWFKKPKN